MIDPKAVTTYAQYDEDIILAALLHDVKKGFYIDVGANYPTVDSVTKHFYDKGWNGINIEPIPSLHAQLEKARKRDINLHCGLGEHPGKLEFREYTDTPGHSTFQASQKAAHDEKYVDYSVPITTLVDLYKKYKVKTVHFIKIDVEGYEQQVVAGNNWEKNRPEVICIEANHVSEDWRGTFEAHRYSLFIKDGLNEYYVAEEVWYRTEGFAERAVQLDYHALKQHQQQSWKADSELIVQQQTQMDRYEEVLVALRHENQLSLRNRPLRQRLKVVAYGLTKDWLEYKRSKR